MAPDTAVAVQQCQQPTLQVQQQQMDGEQELNNWRRVTAQHDERLISLGKCAATPGGRQASLAGLSATEAFSDFVPIAGIAQRLDGVAGQAGACTQQEIFPDGAEPFRKAAQFVPQGPG